MRKGIEAGRRPDLLDGGLVSSVGGWKQAKTRLNGQERIKGDERILGDSNFVAHVFDLSNERKARQNRLQSQGAMLTYLLISPYPPLLM